MSIIFNNNFANNDHYDFILKYLQPYPIHGSMIN